MKSFVLQLVTKVGTPDIALKDKHEEEKLNQLILQKAEKMINNGARRGWKKTLAREMNVSYSKILYLLQQSNIREYSYLKEQEQ